MSDKTQPRQEYSRRGSSLRVTLIENAVESSEAKQLLTSLLKSIDWRATKKSGRINCTYGDAGIRSAYGTMAIPWEKAPPELLTYKQLVERLSGEKANYCAVQLYSQGSVGMKPHRDKEIVSGTAISGLSLGATRTLVMSSAVSTTEDKLEIKLPSGSLYVLRPPTNDHWLHEIKTSDRDDGPRISLTYRYQPVGTTILPGGHSKYPIRSDAQIAEARERARSIVNALLQKRVQRTLMDVWQQPESSKSGHSKLSW